MKPYLQSLFFLSAIATAMLLALSKNDVKQKKADSNEVAHIPGGVPITSGAPPCITMYYNIEKYADEYRIPHAYAYGIAFVETRYEGPFDWTYKPGLTSSAGAVGPMQVMHATARHMWPDSTFTTERLRTDIQFNVRTSMKLLRHLYDKYGDWKIVFGCYNTGRPLINEYAHRVYNFKPSYQ